MDFREALAARMQPKLNKDDITSIVKKIRDERVANGGFYKGQNLSHDIVKMFPEHKREAIKAGMTYGTKALGFLKFFDNATEAKAATAVKKPKPKAKFARAVKKMCATCKNKGKVPKCPTCGKKKIVAKTPEKKSKTGKPLNKELLKKLKTEKAKVLSKKKKNNGGGRGAGGGGGSKSSPVTIVHNTKPVTWKKGDIDKRNANIKDRLKNDDKKKENPNKTSKVLERHADMRKANPGKPISIQSAKVKETRAKAKAAASKMSTKARKPGSKTRKKAAAKVKALNTKQMAKEMGMTVKEAEAAANAILRTPDPSSNKKAMNFAAHAVGVALKYTAFAAIGATAISLTAALLPVLGVAMGGGLMAFLSSTFSTRASDMDADDVTDNDETGYAPTLANFIPQLAEYIENGNLEELIGRIENMDLDADPDVEPEKKHIIHSRQAILARIKRHTEATAQVVPNSVIFKSTPLGQLPTAGFYMCLSMKAHSAQKLERWARDNGIPNPESASNLHCTIVYSKTPPLPLKDTQRFFSPLGLLLPPVKATPKKVQKLGPSAVVITLDFPFAEERNALMMGLGCTSDFPSYIAHTTVGKDEAGDYSNRDFKDIELPAFDLEYDYEYCGPLLTDRRIATASASSDSIIDRMIADKKAALKAIASGPQISIFKETTMKTFGKKPSFNEVLSHNVIIAGRKKKEPDAPPAEHRESAIANYEKVIEFFENMNFAEVMGKIKELVEAAKAASDKGEMKEIAKKLRALVDSKGEGINHDFFSNVLLLDDGPKEIARALTRLATEK